MTTKEQWEASKSRERFGGNNSSPLYELAKRSKLVISVEAGRGKKIEGEIDGEKIVLDGTSGELRGKIGDVDIDSTLAEQLWEKFYPVAKLLEADKKIGHIDTETLKQHLAVQEAEMAAQKLLRM